MSPTKESREEAIKRLHESASALEDRTKVEQSAEFAAHAVTGQAYKIIAELLGGVFVGLGRLFGTSPWGILVGVLAGFALAIYMARRTANRLMAQAKAAGVTGQPVPYVEAGEEED